MMIHIIITAIYMCKKRHLLSRSGFVIYIEPIGRHKIEICQVEFVLLLKILYTKSIMTKLESSQ